MEFLLELNTEQKKAVVHKNGPCLIVAGAGTGKTKVITSRIAYIIAKKWAKPSEILALTFTDKAAQEMEERVDVLVPYGFVDTWISTFHSFGDRILRDYSIDAGLPANFKILSQTEQAIFLRENIYEFELDYFRPLANPTAYVQDLLTHFSRLKDELIEPDEYTSFAHKKLEKAQQTEDSDEIENCKKILELAKSYEKYQDLMASNGNLDYGDQIYLPYKLLKSNKSILKELQEKFKYILLDEFQDTNFAQYQIVKLLASNGNITVVGDDDQSIYRFRGASISNILFFQKDFPNCKQIVLNQNYRSTKQILDTSYELIQHNNPDRLEVKNKINKKLKSDRQGQPPQFIHCDTLSCESDTVTNKIIELKVKHHYKNSDFAILARANGHLDPFIKALDQKKIPNLFIGASSLFRVDEVRMLISFLKCLVYPDDNISFFQLATSELYNIETSALISFYSKVRKENKNYEEIFDELGADNKIALVLDDINKYRRLISNRSAGEVLYQFLKDKNYLKQLASKSTAREEEKIKNVARFFDRIAQFDRASESKSVLSFLENLELMQEVGDEVHSSDFDSDIDAVSLMTVHASKGLEWPVVFVVNMVSDRFPSRDRREKIPIPEELIKEQLPSGNFHLQEERRLFYVACTRAKDFLYFSSADDYGGKRQKKISQFILESLDKSDLIKEKHKLSALEKIEKHAPKSESLQLKLIKKSSSETLYLSRQQIDDYYTCPKKFYFSTVLRIPLPINWHFMYGTAIHEAIGRYYQRKIAGKKVNLDMLINDFEQSFKSEGFITREHEEERKRSGIETLTKFYLEDESINLMPEKIEDSFEFFQDNLKINGRYDLVLKEGTKSKICDFKTSLVSDQKDADARLKKSTQMMIYALAWQAKYGSVPITSLIFIESNIKSEITFSEKNLEKTREMIMEVGEGIRSENFLPKSDQRQCSLCPYKDICKDAKI